MLPAAWGTDHGRIQKHWNMIGAWRQFTTHGPRGANPRCIGNRKLSEVSMPSAKVVLFDDTARHVNYDRLFFVYDDLRQPFLFFDFSVRTRRIGDATRGAHPTDHSANITMPFEYRTFVGHQTWQPNLRFGRDYELFPAAPLMTTRMGLRGVDFGGAEVFP